MNHPSKAEQAAAASPRPLWLEEMYEHIGLREIRGRNHAPTIVKWTTELGAWWKDDETPWCGTAAAHCLSFAGREIPRHWYRAKDYINVGTKLADPCYGAIGVMGRVGGGHVGFVVGMTFDGRVVMIGGNQGDMIKLSAFPMSRFIGFYWPNHDNGAPGMPYSRRYDLPVYSNDLQTSLSEA